MTEHHQAATLTYTRSITTRRAVCLFRRFPGSFPKRPEQDAGNSAAAIRRGYKKVSLLMKGQPGQLPGMGLMQAIAAQLESLTK